MLVESRVSHLYARSALRRLGNTPKANYGASHGSMMPLGIPSVIVTATMGSRWWLASAASMLHIDSRIERDVAMPPATEYMLANAHYGLDWCPQQPQMGP